MFFHLYFQESDILFLDGTFYSDAELGHRDISLVPHPRITQSLALFGSLPSEVKRKIYFIHLNHTNPVMREDSAEFKEVRACGFEIAQEGFTFSL